MRPRLTLRRLCAWTLICLLIGLVLLLAAYAAYRQRVLPVVDGTRLVRSPHGDLALSRDRWGVPTIEADRPEGAWFGLGYAHAQDRLWQLELHRRIGAGRLAEVFGPEALDNDRFLRALGVRRAAEAQWTGMKGEARAALQAYADGVNAWTGQHLAARPPEFLLLGIQPEPWTPVDSLAWSIMMAWDLGGNWSTELLRLRLATRLDLARIQQILPPYPGDAVPAVADYPALVREWQVQGDGLIDRLIGMAPESGVEGVGSNNWAVDGRHSRSGMPLVANDPHLRLSTPTLWYAARLSAPGLHVGGGTIPGLPVVVLGQNDAIAWAFTNTNPDVQDLYLEAVDPDDPMRYRTPEGWARFDLREEVIAVRGRSVPVRMTVRQGRHGPVISDAAGRATEGLTGRAGRPYALALRWTALDADVGNLAAGIGINRAGSIEDFVAAARDYGAPMQNMIVADRQGPHGRIALVLPGKVPLRRPDNDLLGQFPAPGWLARYDWVGFRTSESLPLVIDPPQGWLATANQRTEPPGAQAPLSLEWTRPHRQLRIEQLLAATPQHDVDSFVRMQRDVQSRGAEVLLPAFRAARLLGPVAGIDDTGRAAIDRIQAGFDGEMAAESTGPSLFHAWVQALTRRILADELGAQWQRQFSERRSWRDAIEDILARQDAWWCDDKNTPDRRESCAEQGDAALHDAVQDLRQRLGPDPATWRWSRLHVVHAEHSPFSRVAPLRRLFELRIPVAGDTHAINAMRVNLRPEIGDPNAYAVEHGPGLRTVLDLADPGRSRWMLSTGQSGIALSPDYASLLEPWSRGETLPLWPTEPPAHRLSLRAVLP